MIGGGGPARAAPTTVTRQRSCLRGMVDATAFLRNDERAGAAAQIIIRQDEVCITSFRRSGNLRRSPSSARQYAFFAFFVTGREDHAHTQSFAACFLVVIDTFCFTIGGQLSRAPPATAPDYPTLQPSWALAPPRQKAGILQGTRLVNKQTTAAATARCMQAMPPVRLHYSTSSQPFAATMRAISSCAGHWGSINRWSYAPSFVNARRAIVGTDGASGRSTIQARNTRDGGVETPGSRVGRAGSRRAPSRSARADPGCCAGTIDDRVERAVSKSRFHRVLPWTNSVRGDAREQTSIMPSDGHRATTSAPPVQAQQPTRRCPAAESRVRSPGCGATALHEQSSDVIQTARHQRVHHVARVATESAVQEQSLREPWSGRARASVVR